MSNFIEQPGLQVPFNENNAIILDYFKLFSISDFYQLISDQTNLYPEQHFQEHPDDASRSLWTPTAATMIRRFSTLHFANRNYSKTSSATILEYRCTSSN